MKMMAPLLDKVRGQLISLFSWHGITTATPLLLEPQLNFANVIFGHQEQE